MSGTDLQGVNLLDTDLSGVDLSGVSGLNQKQINKARMGPETVLPLGLGKTRGMILNSFLVDHHGFNHKFIM